MWLLFHVVVERFSVLIERFIDLRDAEDVGHADAADLSQHDSKLHSGSHTTVNTCIKHRSGYNCAL